MVNCQRARHCILGAVLVLLLLPMVISNVGIFGLVRAARLSGLGIWSQAYNSPVVLNASAVANSLVVLNVNATGGARINGFDIKVTWDPTVLTYVSSTYKGGIFDLVNFQLLALSVGSGFVRYAGVIYEGYTTGSGVVITFALKVIATSPGSTSIHIARGILTQPTLLFPTLMDGFFSNVPGTGDLMLTSIAVSAETATIRDIVDISVGLRTTGSMPMTGVVVTVKGNNTIPVNSTLVGTMPANSIQTVTVVWNTTMFALGLYNLNATVTTTSPDPFPRDNSLALEQVTLVVHDLAVTSLSAPPSALANTLVPLSVALSNLGTIQDTANVTILANNTAVARGSFQLSPGSTNSESLGWNTTGFPPGNYALKALVQPVPGERNLANNMYVDGNLTIVKALSHDLQITGNLPTNAVKGQNITFTFLIKNNGLNDENYTVMVLLDSQVILQTTQRSIAPAANATLAFPLWNTRPYALGVHTLLANVTSTSTDENLSNNQVSTQFTLFANQPPIVLFTITPNVPGPGVTTNFRGTMSYDPDGDPLVSYSWSFGDGSVNQTGPIASHAYVNSGTYTVTLSVTDILGATGILQKPLRVNSLPVPHFTFSTTTPQAGSQLTFDASSSVDSDGVIVSYQWDFGDGSTGSGKIVTHTYATGTYDVKLTITDNDGGMRENSMTLTVAPAAGINQAPVVLFGISPSVPEPGTAAFYNGTMSYDPDGDPLASYSWSFGDDSANQTGPTVNHVYINPGTYTVTLTVTDAPGAATSLSKQFRVNSPPLAGFTVNTATPQAGSAITFDASSSTDSDGTITSYQWAFGDGLTGSGRTVTHTYASPGTYQAKLTVTDNDGATRRFSFNVNVAPPTGTSQVAIYAISGAAVLAAGLASWSLLVRRRRSRPTSSIRSNP